LLGISKRGDTYLRTLLIQSPWSVILADQRKATKEDSWVGKLLLRRNLNVVAVALANKNARVVWALLAKDRTYSNECVAMAAGA